MFLKVQNTWFNLDTITRVEIKTFSGPPRTQLLVTLVDRQLPVDVVDPVDVNFVLGFLESKNAADPARPAMRTMKAERSKAPERQPAVA